MPHVAAQIVYQWPTGEIRSREVGSTVKRSAEFLRPETAVPRRREPADTEMPSLSLLVTNPDNPRWDIGSIRHIRNASQNDTPISAVDSVFELPSASSYEETPNSSTHSLFVAELEDTSPHPFSKPHAGSDFPGGPDLSTKPIRSLSHLHKNSATSITKATALRIETPQSPARSIRSSKSQSYLHPGSPAAIASSELCFGQPMSPAPSARHSGSQSHLRSNSGTSTSSSGLHDAPPVPKKPSLQLQPAAHIKSRGAAAIETITAIEDDNRQLLERAIAAEKRAKALQEMNLALQHRVAYCDQHHRPKTAPGRSRRAASESTPISTFSTTPTRRRPAPLKLTPEMKSISRNYDLAACGSPTRPARRPQLQPQIFTQAADISGVIPGSVARQQLTYKGTPISNAPPVATISLAEARRREKPLPYIVPMSPSAVPGFVEMGSKTEVCADETRDLKKKKTFGDLFRWSKRQGVRV